MKKIFFYLLILSIPVIVNAQTPPDPKPNLEEYVGKYVFPDGSPVPEIEIALIEGNLTIVSQSGNASLSKLGVDSFSIVEYGGTAVFRRGDDKKVNLVHIEVMGAILDGTKVPAEGKLENGDVG